MIALSKMVLLLAIVFAALISIAQNAPATVTADMRVRVFCRMDFSGRRLTPAGARQFTKEVLLTGVGWQQRENVFIVKDYALEPVKRDMPDPTFVVHYQVIGRLDSSLGLIRLQTPYTSEPLMQSEHVSLVWTDTRFDRDVDGKFKPVKGAPEWRIRTAPVAPHVGLTAAIQYVRNASKRTKDPMLKARAQKTLADLDALAQLQNVQAQTSGLSQQQPENILSQFAQLQMDGAGLAADESSQLGIFLVHPAQWRQDKIAVARSFGVKRTAFSVNKAEAYVQYESLGEIDLQLRFTSSGANGSTVRQNYKLLFDNDYSAVAGTGNDPYAKIGPSRWRIEQTSDEQWVSVATAIKYVTQMRDSTRDPSIKANADKTLAILAQYR